MSDCLPVEDLGDYLPGHIDAWNSSDAIVYAQQSADGKIDIVGNKAANLLLGNPLQKNVPGTALGHWLKELDQAGISNCCVAGQNLFRLAVEASCDYALQIDVTRTARRGDCQGSANFGTGIEQSYTDAILAASPRLPRRVALVRVLGTDMLFMQSSFPFNEDFIFSSSFKSCQYVDNICDVYIPQLVAQKDLQQVLVAEPDLLDILVGTPSLRNYRPLFYKAAIVDPSFLEDRVTCQQALDRYQTRRSDARRSSAPALSWLDAARAKLGLRCEVTAPVNKNGDRLTALTIYLKVEAEHDPDRLATWRQTALDANADIGSPLPLLRVALLIANCRLGLPVDDGDIQRVLDADEKQEIWWNAAATALTRFALANDSEASWVARLGERGASVFEKIACESDDNYDRMHSAILRSYPELAKNLIPFARLNDHVGHKQAYTTLLKALDDGAEIATSLPSTDEFETMHNELLDALAQHNFVQSFAELADKLPESLLFEKLGQFERLWGRIPGYYYDSLCRLHMANNKFEAAHAAVDAWVATAPGDEDAWRLSGSIFELQGDLPRALASRQRACSMNPENHVAGRELAHMLWSMERDTEAIAVLDRLRTVDSSERNSIFLGKIYFFQENYSQADELFSPISPDDHDNGSAYCAVIACAKTRGWPDAKALLTSCMCQFDSSTLAQLVENLSEFLTARGAAQDAAEYFLPKLVFEDGWSCAIAEVAKALSAIGQYEEAIALWQRAETMPDSALAYVLHSMALTYGEGVERDLGAAYNVAVEGIKKNRESLSLMTLAGESATAAGQDPAPYFKQLIATVDAISIEQRTPYKLAHYALAKYNLGDIDGALSQFENATLSTSPDYALWTSLVCALCAFTKGAKPTPALYAKARQHFLAAPPVEQESNIRHHLLDIETYGRRGMFDGWEFLQAAATECLQFKPA